MRLNYGFPAPILSLQESEEADVPTAPPDDRRMWEDIEMWHQTKEDVQRAENKRRRNIRRNQR